MANKRRSGRAKKKERKESGTEVQDAGPERKTSEQEVDAPVEADNDKEGKIEPDVTSPPTEIGAPPHFEQPELVEHAQTQAATLSKAKESGPEVGRKSGGKRVAENRENIFEGLTKINESVFSLDGVKKAAAWYIETSEKLANQALELQEKATGWAKDTPFASLFEAQTSFARKVVERSAHAARTLWQIHPAQ